MGKIRDYDLLEEFKGDETFIVETDGGTKSVSVNAINAQITTSVEEKADMLNQNNVEVLSDTDSEYKLSMTVGAKNVITPNLKGEKGKSFTYDDFTPEQLAALKGEKGDSYILTESDKQKIAEQVNVPVKDIKVDEDSIVSQDRTATIPYASNFNRELKAGVVKTNPYRYYIGTDENGFIHGETIPYSVFNSEEISRDAFISKGTLMDLMSAFIASKGDVQKKQDQLKNEENIASINGHDLTQGGKISTKEKWVLINSIEDMTKQEFINGVPYMVLYRGDIPYKNFVINVQFPKDSITTNGTIYVRVGVTKDIAIADTINLAGCGLNKGCIRYNAEVRKQGNGNWKTEYSTQNTVYYGQLMGNLVNDQGNLNAMEGAKTIVVAMPYQTNITEFPEGTIINLWGIVDE